MARTPKSADCGKRNTLAPEWQRFWEGCRPVTPDDPAGRYLISRRCALPLNDMRWRPDAWHPAERRHMPALVALITSIATGQLQSLHFTFIAPDGCGKAAIDRPRLYLAGHRKAGGVVRLDPDEAVEQGVIIGEGIESCLSYRLEYAPVWACLDAGGVADFPVLLGLEGLTILIDDDPAGNRAFRTVRDRYRAAGFTSALDVIGVRWPGGDLNDAALEAI